MPNEYIVVRIDDVDIPERMAHTMDTQENYVHVHFREFPGGLTLIPSIGEFWLVERRGWQWYLDKKLDNEEDHTTLEGMSQGDMRLQASGTLSTQANQLYLNNRGLGTTIRDSFDSDAGYDEVTLTHDPVSVESIRPSLNGLQLPESLWRYDADTRTVIFNTTVGEIGSMLVTYQTWMVNNDDAAEVISQAVITAVEEFEDN